MASEDRKQHHWLWGRPKTLRDVRLVKERLRGQLLGGLIVGIAVTLIGAVIIPDTTTTIIGGLVLLLCAIMAARWFELDSRERQMRIEEESDGST